VISLTGIHGTTAEIMEFEVQKNSKISQKEIKKLGLPESSIIGGVIRKDEVMTISGDLQIMAGDRVVVLSLPECIHQVESYFK
jgi:trk system potassium uptake protein TrkA